MNAHRWVLVALTLVSVLAAACGSSRHVAARTSGSTTATSSPTSTIVVPGPAPSTTAAGPGSGTAGLGSTTIAGAARPSTTPPSPASTGPDHPVSTTSAAPRSTPMPVRTGAHGLVTAGPVCPVQRVGDPCLPRALPAVDIAALNPGGQTVARTLTDNGGGYTLALAPGDYTIVVVVNARYPRCPATNVSVTASGQANADIFCDTGIR